ncbi:hypothetical protein M2139_000618 [Enterococcus sp. PF1-24]|uniref:hypothetical protein n=1 Tax=unclassified Enterococcus TaxID=2608891 RepID=UPI002476AEE7|nr:MULTISPECIES: hypothetical protein [unclassified Enterococcus]MDH6363781.1 hypothetical protein [Enterococcus sp. PFB1-1]MDH6400737.1 hypothetical protein [Enterococcus sp. PF1-24]
MITQEVTAAQLTQWQATWLKYKDELTPNRKTGEELLIYLQNKYVLTEIFDENMLEAITKNVTLNIPYSEKLPKESLPKPRAFSLENSGNGEIFYFPENKDPFELWGADFIQIFVGIDVTSGFYMVEGSTMLWDELCAFQGLDEKDIDNYVCVAQYIDSLKRFGQL